jgi:hypothetical protein
MSNVAIAYEARAARDHLRDAARDLDRCRALTQGSDPELAQLAAAAAETVELALVRVGELRHRIAERAMLGAYGPR